MGTRIRTEDIWFSIAGDQQALWTPDVGGIITAGWSA